MSHRTTVICLRETGIPENVVRVEDWDLPAISPRQVRLDVLAAPINPADLNILEGNYARKPTLPAVVGNEGVGVISEIGSDVAGLATGQWVVAPMQLGWWCSARVLDVEQVVSVPNDLPVEQAAMLAVNPPTAYRLLHDFVALKPGDWIIQNAGNSGVGRAVIALAKHFGWRTINVVRRRELIAELQAAGADVVVTDEVPLSRQINELTGGAPVRLGLNSVGGESARQVAKSLAPHGVIVTFGAMAREPLRIENGLLIFKDINFRGFWVSQWYREARREQIVEMFAALVPLVRSGKLRVPVEQTYRLAQAREAIVQAKNSSRAGKILFVR